MSTIRTLSSNLSCRIVGGVYDAARGAFPKVVRIETTNACNAKCTICPHSEMKRPIARMDDGLFKQIIDECAANRSKEVHLHNFGEPLLDKHIEQRVRYAKQQGLKKTKIFSNGALANEDRARGLIEAGLDEIKFSIDGASREEFERIRVPLKFDQVVGNIRRLVEIRDEMQSDLRIRVSCCSTSDKDGTMRALEDVVDGFSFAKLHNWGGEDRPGANGRVRKPCSRLWRTFTILANGDIALCCLDYDGQFLLGHMDETTSIREIWQSPAYRQARRKHRLARQTEIALCANCTKSFL